MKARCCNRCNHVVSGSSLREYKYQCFHCDEDLYDGETYICDIPDLEEPDECFLCGECLALYPDTFLDGVVTQEDPAENYLRCQRCTSRDYYTGILDSTQEEFEKTRNDYKGVL